MKEIKGYPYMLLLAEGEHYGHKWATTFNARHGIYCGYIILPEPMSNLLKKGFDIDISPIRGITYNAIKKGYPVEGTVHAIGFDTGNIFTAPNREEWLKYLEAVNVPEDEKQKIVKNFDLIRPIYEDSEIVDAYQVISETKSMVERAIEKGYI